jgi:hypothetical protein
MATKRMTKKSVATTEEPVKAAEETTPKKTVKATKVEKPKKEFKETDGILCRSVTPGGLYMVGKKTGMKYEWNEYGHEYEVEYRDLVIAVRTRSDFVFGPLFIIEDEDFINEFQIVKKFYEDSYKNQDLEAILRMPVDEMKNAILALPPRASQNFQSIASSAVRDKTLDSLEKIRVLDEHYGIDLKLLAEM